MAVKEMLVYLNGADADRRLDTALALSAASGAHVTGLYVIPERVIAPYARTQIPEAVFREVEKQAKLAAAQAEAGFRAALDAAGRVGETRLARGFVERELSRFAAYADLVVMGQPGERGLMSETSAVEHAVLLGCGRPVLFAPRGKENNGRSGGAIGRRVLLAWNGSREASRAARAALPLLVDAERVLVAEVDAASDRAGPSLSEACAYLARHGVRAEGSEVPARGRPFGDALLEHAAASGYDLVVAGAYGHGRLFELVLGGVTERMLARATVPLLMTH